MNTTPPNFETFFKQFSDALPKGMTDLQKDMEKNMRAAMESTFRRMNLVTREEFDIQMDVLARTRAKIDILEQQVAALEAKLSPADSSPAQLTDSTETPNTP
ncbi:accessory factor UbiK family protein [Candidatus Albibeggiatoa sp. nov. NOAA]|uniref:accessory factor UbiK family protein n=1 Tax=Candidatus Albibeggiatoa sp. nov. NOAA TaxID=3162724 RepID=UPI0032F9200E|nr:accessory factor UbiK family protein [Thiotrichaceae bacterium]